MIQGLEILEGLKGTSPQKLEELFRRMRQDPKVSLMIGIAERLPGGIGDIVKSGLYEMPHTDPAEMDQFLIELAGTVRSLLSDDQERLQVIPGQLAIEEAADSPKPERKRVPCPVCKKPSLLQCGKIEPHNIHVNGKPFGCRGSRKAP